MIDLCSIFEQCRDFLLTTSDSVNDFLTAHQLRTPFLIVAGCATAYIAWRAVENRALVLLTIILMPRVHNARSVGSKRTMIKDELRKLREERGSGLKILEIGCGTGLTVDLLPDDTNLTVVEPLEEFKPLFEAAFKRVSDEKRLCLDQFIIEKAERLPTLEDNSFDAVLMTFVLCSVDDMQQVLLEIHRVLKPGAKLYTIDHIRSSSRLAYFAQMVVSPVWRFFCGNCHLTRYPFEEITQVDFSDVHSELFEMQTLFLVKTCLYAVSKK